MERYKLLLIDQGADGDGAVEFDCASDGEAINRALDRAASCALELWSGDRKILSRGQTATTPTRRMSPLSSHLVAKPRNYTNW